MADEMLKDARKQNEADLERVQLFSSLLKHPGWALYEELLNHHINERTAKLFEPIEPGMRDASEHNKGAVYGMIYSRDLLRVTVLASEKLKSLSTSEDNE